MKRSSLVLTLTMLVVAALAAPLQAQNPTIEPTGFHLLGPGGSAGPLNVTTLCPNEPPPFLHWDLRQFPGCSVPFEVNGNIPAPGNPTAAQAVAAVNLAASSWSQVSPSPVSLFNNSAGALCNQAPAQDDRNCVAWNPNWAFADFVYGVTYIWRDASSGVIVESDVTLNPTPGSVDAWQGSPPNCSSPLIGIQNVMLHEFGHFLGLGHPNFFDPATCADDDPNNTTIMYSIITSPCEITLAQPDKDGVNYLYTPDLADLPDPPYPTKVHSGSASGVTLSGVDLETPAEGAEHLFGIYRDPVVTNRPRYQYEWLGFKQGAIDDHAQECEARAVDSFDDGISASCLCEGGIIDSPISLTMHVKTARDVRGRTHTYNAGSAMYLNGWFDWNGDGDFQDAGEHPIGTGPGTAVFGAGAFTFMINAPPNTPCTTRTRFRLDWREDVGQVMSVDPSLSLEEGAAQHGEVEDYTGLCGAGGGIGGGGIPPKHPPNQYCHPLHQVGVNFPGLASTYIAELCHPPSPIEITTATATSFPAAGQDCMNTALCFKVDINSDGAIDEDLCLTGPVCVQRGAPYVDQADGLRTIDTEMISLDMKGYSHFAGQLTIQLAPGTHSLGQIKQTATAADGGIDVSLESPASSFFDVYWIVKSSLVGTSSVVGPTRVEANISSVPPGERIPAVVTPGPPVQPAPGTPH